ncbi:hypothetical protein CFP56_002869 [Quercus suber]|uniref:Zinc knuckle CX2CX4HX4C domain-containing protein n=1 Tax=Quercus suber TaxID=58331 RepID=A0AAW0LCW7_QUESU
MVSPQVATEVGSRLGVVEDMERRRRQDAPSYFMRVRVALPVSKPLRRGGFIVDSDGGKTWVHFKYERLPMFCHFCGVLGHDFHHCTRHFAAEKGDGDVEYQYGDWMRAFGGQQRSPPRDRTASPKQQAWRSEKHGMNGDAAVHGENIGIHPDFQQPKPVINEMEQIQGDRSIADMDVVSLNLNSDNPVEVYDNKVGNRDMVEKSVISDIPKDVMGPKFVEDVAEKLEENSGHLNVKCNMQGGNVGGPIVSKPKSTWTRIVRMDFGLGKAWLLWEECEEVVKNSWEGVVNGGHGLEGIKDRIRVCGENLRLWGLSKTKPNVEVEGQCMTNNMHTGSDLAKVFKSFGTSVEKQGHLRLLKLDR